ncbi:ARMT1-like domain-containing protein [Thermodesulfobacteriota bacterium]
MTSRESNESGPASEELKESYHWGQDPRKDAWYTAFFIENHLDYFTYPDHVASAEQVRFMVYTEANERYYPCSDSMFWCIIKRENTPFLMKKYEEVLQNILQLVELQIEDESEKSYLKGLLEIKYQHETRDAIMIPSRLEKRLIKIYIKRTQIEDPLLNKKTERNRRASRVLHSEEFQIALDRMDESILKSSAAGLDQIRKRVEYLKLRRLFALSVEEAIWDADSMAQFTEEDYLRILSRRIRGDGVVALWQFLGVGESGEQGKPSPKKVLWLADEAGEIMVDLAIIHYLALLGHKIIIAFKDGPWFTKVNFFDLETDEHLSGEIEGALLIKEKNLAKNELVDILKKDKPVMAISDGTQEATNLLMTSTTFARTFKEVDGIISKGREQRRRFFETRFRFTQDIFSIAKDEKGYPSIWFKPKHPEASKFSIDDLEGKAQAIMSQMEEAKNNGMSVMFYSGIIGSMPGKEPIAKQIMSTFVQLMKEQSAGAFIINPSEHSEPGMDADDLMFMWEIVQRSGLIEIWRFQTNEDILKAFDLMGIKVPPEWVGKDATFSTGCTKEMKIALEVQKEHPEMQIIGPSQEKFLRRQEYGIGKMYDSRLDEITLP